MIEKYLSRISAGSERVPKCKYASARGFAFQGLALVLYQSRILKEAMIWQK